MFYNFYGIYESVMYNYTNIYISWWKTEILTDGFWNQAHRGPPPLLPFELLFSMETSTAFSAVTCNSTGIYYYPLLGKQGPGGSCRRAKGLRGAVGAVCVWVRGQRNCAAFCCFRSYSLKTTTTMMAAATTATMETNYPTYRHVTARARSFSLYSTINDGQRLRRWR